MNSILACRSKAYGEPDLQRAVGKILFSIGYGRFSLQDGVHRCLQARCIPEELMVAEAERPGGSVVVGVTGHRFLVDEDAVSAGVEVALGRIQQTFRAASLTVISPLASGADQLVARRVLMRPESRLVVPLPLPLSSYLEDLAPASLEAFQELFGQAADRFVLPATRTRDEAYEAAGRYVVEHSQVLIAVWDGQPARGRGGTASTVARARQCGLPMAWIWARNQAPGTRPAPLAGEHEHQVQFERFPELVRSGGLWSRNHEKSS
jgi:hypothetical protein